MMEYVFRINMIKEFYLEDMVLALIVIIVGEIGLLVKMIS